MAGIRGRSGPAGNQNAFRYGLAGSLSSFFTSPRDEPWAPLGVQFFVSVSIRNYIVLICLTAFFVIAGCAGEMSRGLPVDRQRTAQTAIEIPRKVLFIHATFLTPKSWDNFSSFFKAKGYDVTAPPWPGKEESVEEQNKNPSPLLETLGIGEIVEHYENIIRNEKEQPILIGHSVGGLIVQILLDRGWGSAGVAIASIPPEGVFSSYPSTARSVLKPFLTPWGWRKIVRWPFSEFQYGFVHTLSADEQLAVYREQIVPESGRIFWQLAFKAFDNQAAVNFNNKARAPLLLIAGSEDRIVPPRAVRTNFRKYADGARTDFQEFAARTHWIIGQPGWEEVAAYTEAWVAQLRSEMATTRTP
jgi:pimeloyl-ACP methyl ester carboxylesterase